MSKAIATWPMALVSLAQTGGAIVAIALGYHYDREHMSPGILTIAGIGLIAGPAFWVALRRALGALGKAEE